MSQRGSKTKAKSGKKDRAAQGGNGQPAPPAAGSTAVATTAGGVSTPALGGTDSPLRRITALGQAIWLDYISRELLNRGQLRRLIDEGLTGVTSNPTIFHKSIAGGHDYDQDIAVLARRGLNTIQIYEALAVSDIQLAADQLRQVYNETHGRDGFVSLEVSPRLAHDTEGTIAEGRRLFGAVGRPNVMIKVPATPEGLPAITTLISEGINVNVTLIFAIDMYERVMQAYIDGVQRLRATGKMPAHVSSVASFFVSRVDTMVDGELRKITGDAADRAKALLGQAAVANAKIAYQRYQAVFEGPQFAELRAAGARVQRPLWASTSTKDPAYKSTKYVDPLIGPNTVNTMPPQTIDASRTDATPARTIDTEVDAAHAAMRDLAGLGIDMDIITQRLLNDGVKSFADSFEALLSDLDKKRAGIRD